MQHGEHVGGFVVGPDQHMPGGDRELKASGRATGGSLTVYESVVDGDGPPTHTHTREDETLYVLDGALQAECGDDTFHAPTGSLVFLPRGRPHTFRSVGGPARVLLIATPGGLDEFFTERDAALAAGAGRAEMLQLAARYGFE